MENGPFYRTDQLSAGKSAAAMAAFCQSINRPNFRLTFDVGHSFLSHGADEEGMLRDLQLLLPYIGHLHLHDNFGRMLEVPQLDDSHRITCGVADIHLPPGWGAIPLERVFDLLLSYTGIINLEIEKRFEDQYRSSIDMVRGRSGKLFDGG